MTRALTFREACAAYVNRYTMEHVPAWAARRPCDSGGTSTKYYAPQYRSDREWYDNTRFPGEPGHTGIGTDCYSSNLSWPLGQWLDKPYRKS